MRLRYESKPVSSPFGKALLVLLLLALLWLLDRLFHLDPLRTGLAALLIYGGHRLVHSRRPVVGVIRFMDREYPLHNIDLSGAVADAKIDLSRAIIPPGEHTIHIRGFVGDVDIYVPYDLDVSVAGSVTVGALNIMGTRRPLTTRGYAEAVSKVRITVSLGIGDVDVRYV
ncbi:MAG TPA: cell wall-active antibiotics response protein LiaF [Symbiobacteriaceae bacterium]|nr:cell wall-active antibiotics response protein LiaF [Symbiobacteriaceae bacterium]